jgi:hypothetical protein
VQCIEVTHSSISFRRKIFSILSIKIQLKWELVAVIYLHYVDQFNQYKNFFLERAGELSIIILRRKVQEDQYNNH